MFCQLYELYLISQMLYYTGLQSLTLFEGEETTRLYFFKISLQNSDILQVERRFEFLFSETYYAEFIGFCVISELSCGCISCLNVF